MVEEREIDGDHRRKALMLDREGFEENDEPIEGLVIAASGGAAVPEPLTYDALPAEPVERLLVLEEIIDRGMLTFQQVGSALGTIQGEKLWASGASKYASWDDYLEKRWADKVRRAQVLARSIKQVGKLRLFADSQQESRSISVFPESPWQMRELTTLKTDDLRLEAWEKAVEMAGGVQPTTLHVRAAAFLVKARVEADASLDQPPKSRGRGSIRIGLPLEKAARTMQQFYTYTELRAMSALILKKGG